MYIFLQSDATLFLGRFHSLTVHLPIGFLLFAAVIFALSQSSKFQFLIKAVPLTLFLGTISAISSVILGFLLAEEGGYPESGLFWHRTMGVIVAILSFGALLLVLGFFDKSLKGISFKARVQIEQIEASIKMKKKQLSLLLVMIVISLSVTGHLGGNLTHGSDYLVAYAPDFVQNMVGGSESGVDDLSFPEDSDSIFIYDHIISKALEQKCGSCHNDAVQKGGLNLSSLDLLLQGGDSGPAVEAGMPLSSELFKRVTMDPSSRKFMPPKGNALSYAEIQLISYWVENGLENDIAITEENMPQEIQTILEGDFGLSTKRKAYYEKTQVEKVPENILENIRTQGFKAFALSQENNFLEVSSKGQISEENLRSLLEVKDNLTWLDLGNAGIKDAWLETIGNFPNLTRLVLDNNPITDSAIETLTRLKHLESINLYNTAVGDSSLSILAQIESLRSLYLWNTKVSEEMVAALKESNPKLKIDSGTMGSKEDQKASN